MRVGLPAARHPPPRAFFDPHRFILPQGGKIHSALSIRLSHVQAAAPAGVGGQAVSYLFWWDFNLRR